MSFSREVSTELKNVTALLEDPDHTAIPDRLEGALERVLQQNDEQTATLTGEMNEMKALLNRLIEKTDKTFSRPSGDRGISRRSYKVFVSSTYLDNGDRRKIVQAAITMAGMVWHGMEIFTASTQPAVEECLRFAKEADVLVGIIAWRYGWEPDGKESITEMEYDAGRNRLMFQIDPTLRVNLEKDFDPGPDKWKKQEKLDAFKKKFSDDQMPAYFNETTLQAKVLQALNQWRERREPRAEPATPRAVPYPDLQVDDEIRSYCQKAESLHETLPVAGFVTQLKVPIDIEDIYVPLRAMVDLRGVAEETFHDAAHAEKCLRESRSGLEIPLVEAFRQAETRSKKGIVILGEPGSGKTTHLKRLLLWCLRKGPETLELPAGMLPVFLPLRDLKKLDKGLDAFIQDQLASPNLNTPKDFGERLLGRGNLLFLLDGLDEVANLSRREQVARWVTEAIRQQPTCRFVLTCRFAGYSPTVHLSEDFLEMHVRPLTSDQVKGFVHNWYRIVETGLANDLEQAEGIASEKADHLVRRLRERDFRARRVFELTRNPLLLTNICLVHRHRGALPRKRARLYEECIDVLLEHWHAAKGLKCRVTAQDGRRALQPAALWLHGEEGRTRAKVAELAPHIDPVLKTVNWPGGTAEDFLRTVRDDSGLLTGWDQEHYGFMHLAFQEYLAAREIRTRAFEDPSVLRDLAAHFGESWWEEVGLLLVALEDPSLFVPYMREVVKQPTFAQRSPLLEACLDDAAETSVQPFVELLEATPGKDRGLWDRQLACLRVLERLDSTVIDALQSKLAKHPSPEIRKWIQERALQAGLDVITADRGGYELVKIPDGVFLMGSPESEDGRCDYEEPLHEVRVPGFYMGRYPVTNEEYGLFLNENLDMREPVYWADRRFNQPRQPVVGVSREDAEQYAAWAGLRLPTEAEWEYACRANTSTRYYSGDKKEDFDLAGWYSGNSGDRLHPVGEKEPNGLGLYDMLGNVWEWVEDDWHANYNDAPTDGRAWIDDPRGSLRVIRGGSWGNDVQNCRSAFRSRNWPVSRSYYLGFRLSRSLS
ncbi:SUMF1/EgtB/PvdO family nonheme iron enzyme [bacterium]|nr:SUMF1/EgtB/PvdO family nonheme iron enzyme [bacterium]